MRLEPAVLLVLGALPFLLVVFHGMLARALKPMGVDLGPQLTAFALLILLNAATASLFFATGDWRWPDLGYVVLTANAMWFVYFQVFVNLSLTSLHARLMLEALWKGAVEPRSLTREYDSEAMLAVRLDRLARLGQIAIKEGTVSLYRPVLLWLSYPLYWWRRLIGLQGERLHLAKAPGT